MTEKLVTVLRARVVVEECVVDASEFHRINNIWDNEDEDEGILGRLEALPFSECDFDAEELFDTPRTYLAFAGNVTSHSDDLASFKGNWDEWEQFGPIELDDESIYEKRIKLIERIGSAQRR